MYWNKLKMVLYKLHNFKIIYIFWYLRGYNSMDFIIAKKVDKTFFKMDYKKHRV